MYYLIEVGALSEHAKFDQPNVERNKTVVSSNCLHLFDLPLRPPPHFRVNGQACGLDNAAGLIGAQDLSRKMFLDRLSIQYWIELR